MRLLARCGAGSAPGAADACATAAVAAAGATAGRAAVSARRGRGRSHQLRRRLRRQRVHLARFVVGLHDGCGCRRLAAKSASKLIHSAFKALTTKR